MSLQTGVISEHTRMIVLEGKEVKETDVRNEVHVFYFNILYICVPLEV